MSRARMSVGMFGNSGTGHRSRLRRGVASVAAGATFTTLALSYAPPAAQAAEPDAATKAVDIFFRKLANGFLQQMASSSAVSQQLPTLAVTPAESVGLRTAFSDALASGGVLEKFGTQETLSAAAGYVNGQSGKDGWTFTSSAAGSTLVVGFKRVVDSEAGLDIRKEDGSFSLSSGDGIDVKGTLTGSFTFAYDSSTVSLKQPSMSIATTGDLPDGQPVKAGLGILGVQVLGTTGDDDYGLTSNVSTVWGNPDNDADGALAFDNPATTDAADGELSAPGAATGIVTATRSGALKGHLVATKRSATTVTGLPDVGGTVDLSSTASGASFDAPQITATVDAAAKPFLTLTPRDLAAGLSQAASAVLGMQNAKDGDLPLMRGSIANAVDAVGAIKQFLAKEVPDADKNDKTPGQPTFSSLQDMLTKLDGSTFSDTGWSIAVLGGTDAATYDPTAKKASFTIKATRAGVADAELNVLGAATSGNGTYKSDGITSVVGAEFPMDGSLNGRKVTSGTSYGTVKSIDSPTSLTLTGDWEGGQPAPDAAFAVEAADPKTGAPQLADTLKALTGIGVANADVSTARITPKVELTLPMALDLSAPLMQKSNPAKPDCNPDPDVDADCPFQVKDASGLGRVITSLPLASDRILLRQSPRDVLVADAAIDSPAQITTTSGYLGLSISGTLQLRQASGEHLQTIKLTKGTLATPVDVPIPAFVEATRLQATRTAPDAADVFSQTLAGKVTSNLTVTVDDADDVFASGVDGSSTTLKLTANVNDLKGGDTSKVTVTADQPARAKLLKALNFDTDNPDSLFGGLRQAFEAAGSDLTTMTGGGLDETLPLLGTSISQLVGAGAAGAEGVTYGETAKTGDAPAMTSLTDPDGKFTQAFLGRQIVVGSALATILGVSEDGKTLSFGPQLASKPNPGTNYLVENELLGAVHVLTATAPQTLQEALAIASDSLGGDSEITFGLVDQGGTSALKLNIEWARKYEVGQAVSLELPTGSDLVAAGGGGELSIAVDGTIALGLIIPLSTDAMTDPLNNVKVDKAGSSIDLNLKVAATNAHFNANVGPIGVEMGRADEPGSVKAGIGVSITSGSSAASPSIKDFFTGGFSPEVTDGGSCGGGTPAKVLCASFPTWVNKAEAGTLEVNTTLDPSQKSIKDALTTTVTVPDVLKNAIAGAPFKIGSLSEGLQQYLFYTEVALRTASDDGEMPVIGKDLQAGADFLGDTRKKIGEFIAKQGAIDTVGPLSTYLTTQLNDSLSGLVDGGAGGIKVDFTCRTTLEPPTPAPTATATDAAPTGTTRYFYKIVTEFNDTTKTPAVVIDSMASEASAAVTNDPTMNASNKNEVKWKAAPNATGYKVLRASTTTATDPVASAYQLVERVGAPSGTTDLSYIDDGAPAPTDLTKALPTKAPYLPGAKACATTDDVYKIEGVKLGLKLGQGTISAKGGCEGDKCLTAKLPVDLGIPGLSLKTGEDGGVEGKVGWSLDVAIGMSRSKGFYIDTTKENEFAVAASLGVKDVSGTDLQAQLAIIDVDVTKRTKDPEFVGLFGIDIKGGTADGDNELTMGELTSLKIKQIFVVGIQAKVNVDWHLEASASAALPGVSTNFLLTWSWGLTSGGAPAATPGKPGDTSTLVIAFNDVTLNTGKFFGEALKPYLQQIVDATKPLQPIIDTIFTPMPVISDLSKAAGGDEVTIATLAEKFNTLPGGAKIQPFLKAIKLVKQLLTVSCDTSCGIKIGSFQLNKKQAATTQVSAGSASSMIDRTPTDKGGTYAPDTKASENIAGADKTGQLAKPGAISKIKELTAGLSIPVMEDPTLLFELIAGGDIPLVEFDSGPLSLGFQFQKSFGPIYAPPPVMMVIGGGASVTLRIAAGFDTYGIRRAIETGDGAEVLDSLYFKTVDKDGTPIPVVQFSGYLEAGASVSIGILEVGVVGGIKLTVGFYWNDPNSDGKFRLFEFGQAVANNPICLFNVSGELSLYIKVFVEIGFSPFSVSFDFNLINIKLLDFNLKPDCEPKPPRLGGVTGTTLYVFAGKLGTEPVRGTGWDSGGKDETWVIRQVPQYTDDQGDTVKAAVEVKGLGLTESFDDDGGKIDTVVLDGRDYAGKLTVTFVGGSGTKEGDKPKPFTKKTIVFTGAGDDVIRTGEGDSIVDSGAGNDTVTTLDRPDLSVKPSDAKKAVVAGGPGNDAITVGNGDDVVTGDGSLAPTQASPTVEFAASNAAKPHSVGLTDVVSGAPTPSDTDLFKASVSDKDGSDQIAAGLGTVKLGGNGGNDTVGTANDSPLADSVGIKTGTTGGSAAKEALYRGNPSTIVGGAGSDVLKSGSAADKLYTGSFKEIGEEGAGDGDDASKDVNTVDSGSGSDTVYGSNAVDFVTTHSTTSQSATVFGGAGNDVLTGGQGTDKIYGGPDDDYVVAAPATVGGLDTGTTTDVLGKARVVTVLPGAGPSSKLLVGGTGQDRIYGSDGPSEIYGDTTTDKCTAQTDPVSAQPSEAGADESKDKADLILGGAGVDTVNAGGGADWAYTAGGKDVVCGNKGADHLYAGDADDLVHGGSGNDQAYGEAGNDQVYGNSDNDALYGGAGNDRVQGNDGTDWVDGGSEDDVVLGGTSKAGTTDGADTVLGGPGSDYLVGDNAQSDLRSASPYPTDLGSSDTSFGGNDYVVGGDDRDFAYGGLGDDTVYGGKGDDYAEGNPGTDDVSGEDGDDDLIGGSSELADGTFTGSENGRPDTKDRLYGGTGQDVIAGDNARITRGGPAHPLTTNRVTTGRGIDLADENVGVDTSIAGDDLIRAGDDNDVVFGQRGKDDVGLGAGADYGEGGQDADSVHGDGGDDDVVGGSYTQMPSPAAAGTGQPDVGDRLYGDAGQDVVLGDNGSVLRPAASTSLLTSLVSSSLTLNRVAQRTIAPYDLGDSPTVGTSGPDTITGDDDNDVLLGQGDADSVDGGASDDYAEGGQGSDLVRGSSGDDDLLGGSSASASGSGTSTLGQPDTDDNVQGGDGSDLVVGDNGLLTRVGRDWRTDRADASQNAKVPGRTIALYDLNGAAPLTTFDKHFGKDALSGQGGVDVVLGQDGDDAISGGADDDYAEGQGGADRIRGDLPLVGVEIVSAPVGAAWTTPAADGPIVVPGQDDLTGGWSASGYRDGGDWISGDGNHDFVVGDNGSVARTFLTGTTKERTYTERYASVQDGQAKVRVAGGGATSTRFCPKSGSGTASTCEVGGAWGQDQIFGDTGQDVLYGQDGDDTIRGGGDDDDIYGELGNDLLFGEDGADAILGDRGGVQNRYQSSGQRSVTTNQPPAETFLVRRAGSVNREADLLHDVNGSSLANVDGKPLAKATDPAMPLDGINFGGNDRIRGGNGNDSIHAGAGEDLANGDTGGDAVFGDGGKDVLWGGKGMDCKQSETDCQTQRGSAGEWIDHLAGGKGEDVLDWRPRGTYGTGPTYADRTCSVDTVQRTTKGVTADPCSWFEMTDRVDDDPTKPATIDNNQHHQGVDWMYGGWDRDVMQGDQAMNGPNPGDRMIDWNGAYNYWSHCNAAYGGWNDLRSPSPAIENFLREWAAGLGSGQPGASASAADVVTPGTSAFEELGLVYNGDQKDHGVGSAYPTTPGHFDDPNACGVY